MKLFLVRHGETDLNKDFRFIGKSDPGLSVKGLDQAQEVAEMLGGEGITAVYSSPLIRSRQTAEIIAFRHKIKVTIVKELEEIDFGSWEGLTYNEIEALDGKYLSSWIDDPINIAIPNGEKWERFENRVIGIIDRIVKDEKDGNIVVVSHGGPIRLLIGHFQGNVRESFKAFWPSPGSISVVDITEGKIKVSLPVCNKDS